MTACPAWTLVSERDRMHTRNTNRSLRAMSREAHMITWEMATIMVLVAFIMGLMTAIKLLKN